MSGGILMAPRPDGFGFGRRQGLGLGLGLEFGTFEAAQLKVGRRRN